jgi:hypothetical protein
MINGSLKTIIFQFGCISSASASNNQILGLFKYKFYRYYYNAW